MFPICTKDFSGVGIISEQFGSQSETIVKVVQGVDTSQHFLHKVEYNLYGMFFSRWISLTLESILNFIVKTQEKPIAAILQYLKKTTTYFFIQIQRHSQGRIISACISPKFNINIFVR